MECAFLLVIFCFLVTYFATANIKDHQYESRIRAWLTEIENSLKRNVKGKCTWRYTDTMNQSIVSDSESVFLVRKFLPSKADYYLQHSLPETFSLANEGLEMNSKARRYSFEDWGKEVDSRWEIPKNHPGQNRKNCLQMSFLASKGTPVSFYNEFRDIDRAFYIAYIQGGFVHPSGAVGTSCGYYMGEECCENRWDYANEWYSNCRKYMSEQNLQWSSLWDESLPENVRSMLIEKCTDHRDLGLPYNGQVESHVPQIVSKVFVMPALWDYNYHHFIADSLGRMAHSLRFLRRHPDIMIHVREFEKYDSMNYRDKRFAENARSMRCRLFELLGIECNRLVTGMVLAADVIIPRCTRCAYSLSNPIEIRLLRKQLLQASLSTTSKSVHSQQQIDSKGNILFQAHAHKLQLQTTTMDSTLPGPHHHKTTKVIKVQHSKTKNHSSRDVSHRNLNEKPGSQVLKRNLTMVVMQRWSMRTTDRDWNDETLNMVVDALRNEFPSHQVLIVSSKDTKRSDYCLACDILKFAHADILVGAHGAGLTNLMFLAPNSLLIEIAGEYKDVNMPVCGYYGPMASMFGIHHYLYVHGMGQNDQQPPMDAKEMAAGASKFYQLLHGSIARQNGNVIRITNSTGGPMSCRP